MTTFPSPYSVDVALSTRSHERIGGRRTDDAWLAERWADQATRVLVLAGGRFPLQGGTSVRWLSPQEADQLVPGAERVLLGERDGLVHLLVLPRGFRAPDEWGTMRTHGPGLPASDQGFVVQAVALDEWRRSHRHCGRCGHALEPASGGYVLHCPSCGRQHFPRTDPAVIMLITDDDARALSLESSCTGRRVATSANAPGRRCSRRRPSSASSSRRSRSTATSSSRRATGS